MPQKGCPEWQKLITKDLGQISPLKVRTLFREEDAPHGKTRTDVATAVSQSTLPFTAVSARGRAFWPALGPSSVASCSLARVTYLSSRLFLKSFLFFTCYHIMMIMSSVTIFFLSPQSLYLIFPFVFLLP